MSGQDTNSHSGRQCDEIVEFHRDATTATVSSSVATGEEVGWSRHDTQNIYQLGWGTTVGMNFYFFTVLYL